MEEHRGQTKGGLNNVPIQARESTPIRTIVLSRPDAYIAVSVYAYVFPYELLLPGPIPNNYTVPEARSRAAPFVIGEEQPQTRRNPTPRPRKGPIQAPNPNKSTPIRPRAGPEHRRLPPHGMCGTILPYPAYLELYLVPHVR